MIVPYTLEPYQGIVTVHHPDVYRPVTIKRPDPSPQKDRKWLVFAHLSEVIQC